MHTVKLEPTHLRNVLFTCAALVVIFIGIQAASNILVPFLLSVFVAIICNPIMRWLMRRGLADWAALSIVLIVVMFLGLMVVGLIGRSVTDLTRLQPEYRQQLGNQVGWIAEKLAVFNIHLDRQQLMEALNPSSLMSMTIRLLSGLGGVVGNLFLIFLTVAFMLMEAASMPARIHLALRDPDMKMRHIDHFLAAVNRYLAIKTLISLITGLAVALLLWWLDVRYYVLWSVIAFLLNYIPNIGSIIAALPVIAQTVIFQGPATALMVTTGYLVINTVMGSIIEPRWMGRGLGLSTLAVFLSLIFWGWLLGTVGMLLSVPLTMVVKILLESTDEGRWFAVLISPTAAEETTTEAAADAAAANAD